MTLSFARWRLGALVFGASVATFGAFAAPAHAQGLDSRETPLTLPSLPSLRLELDSGSPSPLAQKYVPGERVPEGMQPPPEYRYTPGDMLPEGYHIEDRPKRGFLITGYLVAGIPYGVGLLTALSQSFENQSHYLVLPIAGPWLTLASRQRACNEIGDTGFDSFHCASDRFAEAMLITDGVLQAIGGTFLVLGYSVTTPYAVRDDAYTLLFPARIGSGYGFVATGTM